MSKKHTEIMRAPTEFKLVVVDMANFKGVTQTDAMRDIAKVIRTLNTMQKEKIL